MSHYGAQPLADALLLVVEIGNTTSSIAVFRDNECLEVHKVLSETFSTDEGFARQLAPVLMNYPLLRDAALCSVVPSLDLVVGASLRRYLAGEVVAVTSGLQLPFTLHYESPDSFGADRIALCAQGHRLYPEEAVIALDIGTAITVDVLGSNRHYLGGLILPGLDLMARSLHQHTARLPLVSPVLPDSLVGCSTADCIRNGIIWGCVSGIEGVVMKIKRWLIAQHNEETIRVIATGGNAPLIAGLLDSSPVLDELAVLKGTSYLFSLNALSSR